jgi:hypothetical protein
MEGWGESRQDMKMSSKRARPTQVGCLAICDFGIRSSTLRAKINAPRAIYLGAMKIRVSRTVLHFKPTPP